jgi:hypothetical protein
MAGNWLTSLVRGLFSPFSDGPASGPALATLSIAPARISPGKTTTVTLFGTGTSWLTAAPTFTATGAPTGDVSWSLTPTVLTDTTATLAITTGTIRGAVTFTDSTTTATTTMNVAPGGNKAEIVAVMARRRSWRR